MMHKTSLILKSLTLAAIICTGASLSAGAGDLNRADPFAYSVQNDVRAAQDYLHKNGHDPKAAKLYEQAVELMRKQRVIQAKLMLDEVTNLDGHAAEIYNSKGYCQLWMGNYQPGVESMTKAIAIDPTKPIYFYRKALCHIGTFDQESAVKALDQILEKKPDDCNALRLQIRCLKSIPNEEKKAIEDCNRLIKLNAYKAETLCQRGELLSRLKQDDKALQDFEASQKLDPTSSGPFIGRANIFYKQGNYKLAAENYTAASVYSRDADQINFCFVQKNTCLGFLKQKKTTPSSPDLYGPGVRHNNL